MISIIVPTRNQKLLDRMVNSILVNRVMPDEIIILDNTEDSNITVSDTVMLAMRVRLKRCHGMSVNHMWNAGISLCGFRSAHDVVCLLNDDIQLSPFYFDAARTLLSGYDDAAVFIPRTSTDSYNDVQTNSLKGYGKLNGVRRREGWAMAFRASVLKSISQIPHDRIPTFCGDDWFWYHTHKDGHRWITSSECLCYHEVSSTVKPLGYMQNLKTEKNEFAKIIQEMGCQN